MVEAYVDGPGGSAAPSMARRMTGAVVIGYALDALVVTSGHDLPRLSLLAFAGCLSVVLVLQLVVCRPDALTWRPRTRAAILAVQVVVVLAPLAWAGPVAGVTSGFLAASALLLIAGPARWLAYLAIGCGVLLTQLAAGLSPLDITYSVYFTLLTGLMLYGMASLASLAQAVATARGHVVRMAVVGERLRIARDMHDLLGFTLSAVVLNSELAHRLLPTAPGPAKAALRDVLTVARKALSDVRAVADGYAPMSLSTEAESACSMMAAAEISVQVDVAGPELPAVVNNVLAIVLREAATNILRHSKAEQALIRLTQFDGQVRLQVENDGLPATATVHSFAEGSGLRNLADRMKAIGGDLDVQVGEQWLRLSARAPLQAEVIEDAEAPDVQGAGRPGDPLGGPAVHLRTARLIVVAVILGYGLLLLVNALPLASGAAGLVATLGCVAVQVGLLIVIARGEPRQWSPWRRAAVLAAQAVACAAPLVWLSDLWGSMGGFLAGSLLLLLTGVGRWICFALVGLAVLLLSVRAGEPVRYTTYLTLSTLLTGLVLYGVSMLSGMVVRVERFRRQLARLAVEADRLRAARELNELLGRDLSAINAKSELAYRLLPRHGEAANQQVLDVLEIARRTVAQVRAVASGYRDVTFAAEIEATERELQVAGIRSRKAIAADALAGDLDAALAVILRQITTGVLDHPGARHCTIEVATHSEWVCLRVADDGGPAPAVTGSDGERGELSSRVSAIGGRIAFATVEGWQEVVVELPLRDLATKEPTE